MSIIEGSHIQEIQDLLMNAIILDQNQPSDLGLRLSGGQNEDVSGHGLKPQDRRNRFGWPYGYFRRPCEITIDVDRTGKKRPMAISSPKSNITRSNPWNVFKIVNQFCFVLSAAISGDNSPLIHECFHKESRSFSEKLLRESVIAFIVIGSNAPLVCQRDDFSREYLVYAEFFGKIS